MRPYRSLKKWKRRLQDPLLEDSALTNNDIFKLIHSIANGIDEIMLNNEQKKIADLNHKIMLRLTTAKNEKVGSLKSYHEICMVEAVDLSISNSLTFKITIFMWHLGPLCEIKLMFRLN